ncbi:MAG: hypothetical protein M3R64_06985 [Pseudomonadota bacterium]|nr:hypothetical protein [Pseudomonadota bacterium]
MLYRFAAATALAIISMPIAAEQATSSVSVPSALDLVCPGQGTLHLMRQVPDNKRDEKYHSHTQSYNEPFDGVLRIRIRGDQADAMLPQPMLAQTSQSGWRPIKKLAITEAAIDGKVDLGFLYAPVFHIDRYAGTLSLSGSMNAFEGDCHPYEASERQF